MAIRRRCKYRKCQGRRGCLEHLQFDVKHQGTRFRMTVNEFAIPRMETGKQRPVRSMEEARDWERLFIGEIKAGQDPRRPLKCPVPVGQGLDNVAGFLDAYIERCVKPAGLRSINSVRSRVAVLKQFLGMLPVSALEEPDEINRFKTESEYADEVEIATMHRSLETLRAAMNWGMAQTPPLFNRSPFHRFGVRLSKKAETLRDRRLSRDEEKRLLDAALQKMNVPEHQFVGALLHDRLIGALELCCRRGEMLLIQNKRVNWETCQIGIPARDGQGQGEPPHPVQSPRTRRGDSEATLHPWAGRVRVRQCQRSLPTEHSDAWETLRLLANGIEPKPGREGAQWNREQLERIDLR